MHKIEYDLLSIFKNSPETEISTSEILKQVLPKKYEEIEQDMDNSDYDKKKVQDAKRKKATLHKRLLYHLNKLVTDDILKVTKQGEKGEKYFALELEKGEQLILERKKRKVTIYKPVVPAMPLEGDEKKGLVTKFETSTWIDRVNAVLLECRNLNNIDNLEEAISNCFSSVNDVIALNNFEEIVFTNTEEVMKTFSERIIIETKDYGKKLCFNINLHQVKNQTQENKIIKCVKQIIKDDEQTTKIIFQISTKWLLENKEFLTKIIDIHIKNNKDIFLQNKDLLDIPFIIGRAGPYLFDKDEWEIYKNTLQEKNKGVVCSQSTITIDVQKVFEEGKNVDFFREFVRKMVLSLLSANSLQRRRAEEYFKQLLWLTEDAKSLFSFSRNFIRYENYKWEDPNLEHEFIIDLLNETKNEIDTFCIVEENIYKSCGIPTRFKIGFSSILNKKPIIEIKKFDDFYSDNIKEELKNREKLFRIFSGGDIVVFKRKNSINPEDICRDINVLMTSYSLPIFSYSFGKAHTGNLKLTNFIE